MMGLASNPEMVRNVAIVGHLHHGKTSLVDMLVYETHKIDFDCDKPVRIHFFELDSFLICSFVLLNIDLVQSLYFTASLHRHSFTFTI